MVTLTLALRQQSHFATVEKFSARPSRSSCSLHALFNLDKTPTVEGPDLVRRSFAPAVYGVQLLRLDDPSPGHVTSCPPILHPGVRNRGN